MTDTIVYLGLGSNLGDRKANIHEALRRISENVDIHVNRLSNLIETAPLGSAGPSRFVNGVAELRTSLNAQDLLERLMCIEDALGRTRSDRWSPRPIDLDILLFGPEIIDSPELTVPHRQMHLRSFVLRPLCQLAPDLVHPVLQETVSELAMRLNGCDFALDASATRLVSIAGNIGAGKTTLATELASALNADLLREPYDTNPFLPKVYAGQTDLALDSQLYFLVKRAEQLNAAQFEAGRVLLADYVFQKELIYARLLLTQEQLKLYESIYARFLREAAPAMLVVYLNDPPAECLERIHRRNRPYEQGIEVDFLNKLAGAYEYLFDHWSRCPVIRLTSSRIDYSEPEAIEHLVNQITYYTGSSVRMPKQTDQKGNAKCKLRKPSPR